jgi:hypothetical protein
MTRLAIKKVNLPISLKGFELLTPDANEVFDITSFADDV